jgi:hypothetical protein
MITLNGNNYKLVLVDTNILSEVIKNRFEEFRKLFEWTATQKSIICFSLFTILEIRKTPAIYSKFLELFSAIPCIILKSHEQLLQDEVSAYPNSAEVDPILVGFPGVLAKAKLNEILDKTFGETQVVANEKLWNSGQKEIVSGISGLVKNFPPENGKYTKKKIREFIQLAGFQQIALRQREFAKSILDLGGTVNVDAFPSVKMTAFVVFYKFYVDARRPLISDAFDIIIFSATPYVDVVISENHFVEMLKKIKIQDKFVEHVEAFNIKNLRSLK